MEPGKSLAIRQPEEAAIGYPATIGVPVSGAIGENSTLREYLNVLKKRRWVIIAVTVVTVTLGALVSFRMTKMYDSVVRIVVYRENADVLGFKDTGGDSSDDWDYTVALDTQVRILQSDALALRVAKQLQSEGTTQLPPPQAPVGGGEVPKPEQDDPTQDSALIGALRGGLNITVIPRTRIIEIRYTSPDPKFAARAANALANAYIEQNFRTKYESTMQTSDWLAKQLANLQMAVQTSQEKLVRYQKENGILGIDEKQNIVTTKLDQLNRELTGAETDRIQKEANVKLIASNNPELVSRIDVNGLMPKLRAQEADLETQRASLTIQFGPQYPKVVEVTNQLNQVRTEIRDESNRMAGRIRTEYAAALQREKMLRDELDKQKAVANQLNESSIEYNLLKRDADTNRQLYEGLLQKMKEAGVSAGLRSSNIRIVDSARVPTSPSRPNIPRNIALSFVFGLAVSVALAFMLESLDRTVHSPEEVEQATALPAIGLIPLALRPGVRKGMPLLPARAGVPDKVELVSQYRPKSEIAECYRALRTSILLSSQGAPPKVILVTSALPQEGKTTTSLNCALVLAQKGARVLLIDADMRRPGVHVGLGVRPKLGLSTFLSGNCTAEEAVVRYEHAANLFVLPAGPIPPHPAELLGSQIMRNALAEWRQQYDHVVIDTPPALTVTDAVLLSVQADSVILVIRSGSTSRDALKRARDILLHVNAKVAGVVVNAVDTNSPDVQRYYYYGAKYYYGEAANKS